MIRPEKTHVAFCTFKFMLAEVFRPKLEPLSHENLKDERKYRFFKNVSSYYDGKNSGNEYLVSSTFL